MEIYSKKRINIIVENIYQDKVIKLLEDSGASGFTVYKNITGKGRHGIKRDHGTIGSVAANIELYTITSPEVADQILLGLKKMIDNGVMLIVHIMDVSVIREDYFSLPKGN